MMVPSLALLPIVSLISARCDNTDTKKDDYLAIKTLIFKKLNELSPSNKKKLIEEINALAAKEEEIDYIELSKQAQIILEKLDKLSVKGIRYDASNQFYAELDGLSGQQLRNKLFELQLKHRNKTGNYSALHRTYEDAFVDKYYENDGTVLDIYTEIPNGKDKFVFRFNEYQDIGNKEGTGMNREHIIPQSWFKKSSPMREDAHHVWPTDKYVNARHGNSPYGTVIQSIQYQSSNGTKIGTSQEDNDTVTEVIDEFKGDVARALLYFVLTYHDRNIMANEPSRRVFIQKNNINWIKDNYLKTYLKWNENDYISQFDIDRNNGIFKHQGNRNPFSDYPELIKVYFLNDDEYVFKNKGVAIGIN
ncbi:endonuclease [Mycoplasma enhydrae]|nr:endonuclease [Mycoplasma enhydrae]